ncbi:LysR family transcriptional regulator [Rhodoferax sp. TS-BS-61-7]|uniref:LysR family transcriptional regulator n=1 Tax=Rhodoferax sp. TS-BS-61-7 TaxID=2094194 RepID=UPI000CF66C4A|nr:LysR family transcriptional regulator [Rhodoferax sp. TS-BS-61-7]PQA77839.1 hypothetical protein C5F53_09595 [Rhodoferax sp. TS-BS-61-7]
MDLSDLRIFCRVAELTSFTKAAEHLNMAKGRVSTIVQLLETEVGRRQCDKWHGALYLRFVRKKVVSLSNGITSTRS